MFFIIDGKVYIDFLWMKVKFREKSERDHFSVFTENGGEHFLWWRRRIGSGLHLTFHWGDLLCGRYCAEFSRGKTAANSCRKTPLL